jgi:polysaccharide pyruvyl transferase WcaK-like protein
VHYRSYRDNQSKDFLRSIGLNVDHDPVYPDLAFGLPSPLAPSPLPQKQEVTVGVGIMRYHGWRGQHGQGAEIYEVYLCKIVEFILGLLDRRFRVRLLIGDEGDEAALKDILSALALARPDYPRSALVLPEQSHSLHQIMMQMLDTDFVVATRFHNIVCALKMKKPCISIGYAPKFDVLMEEMGLGQFCQHIERLDVVKLTEQLEKLMANKAAYQQVLETVSKEYQQLLSHQEDVLRSTILA